jgi:excisionase family DNA binding protein
MNPLLSTREVARLLNVNEKMVYTLVAEKGLPASKVTGKWLFPRHLVEQWVETQTINYPDTGNLQPLNQGILILAGSNDPLLDSSISLFNSQFQTPLAVFGNLGSMGGLRALRQNLCHIASSHLLQEDEEEYNFDYAFQELDLIPAVVNFWRRAIPKRFPGSLIWQSPASELSIGRWVPGHVCCWIGNSKRPASREKKLMGMAMRYTGILMWGWRLWLGGQTPVPVSAQLPDY